MKYISLIFALVLFIVACNNDDKHSNNLPSCIQNIVETDSLAATLQTVKKCTPDNEAYYWLNTGYAAFDGAEYIVNEQCDTVCYIYGFCLPPMPEVCEPTENWAVVWEK